GVLPHVVRPIGRAGEGAVGNGPGVFERDWPLPLQVAQLLCLGGRGEKEQGGKYRRAGDGMMLRVHLSGQFLRWADRSGAPRRSGARRGGGRPPGSRRPESEPRRPLRETAPACRGKRSSTGTRRPRRAT